MVECAISATSCFHDFSRFQHNIEIYKQLLYKTPVEGQCVPDQGKLKDKYPDMWAILTDKGYQGAQHLV